MTTVTYTTFDIVGFIEKNPLSRLNTEYQNALINKIKSAFTEEEQKLFVTSFYCYLNYNPITDFVIDFEDVWKWCGFSRKDASKRLLEKHFTENINYKIQTITPPIGGVIKERGGTHRKEKIMLNIKTFKKFCLKSDTEKSNEIHDYYIKLEEILQDVLLEQTDELKLQLDQKEALIEFQEEENIKQSNRIKLLEIKTSKKVERTENGKNVIYIITNEYLKNDRTFIVGKAISLINRMSQYNKSAEHEVVFQRECNNAKQMSLIEENILYKLDKYRERANRDRFILPEGLCISLFINVVNKACDWFDDVDDDVVVERLTDDKDKEYYEDNKEYIKEYKKQHYEENKEEINKKNKAWYEENKEEVKVYNQKYREENKDKIKEQKAIYKAEHKEEYKERDARYYRENKEELKIKQKLYNEENKENILAQRKEYYNKNIESIREKDRARNPKVICECGLSICKRSLPSHRKSKTHEMFMNKKNDEDGVDVEDADDVVDGEVVVDENIDNGIPNEKNMLDIKTY